MIESSHAYEFVPSTNPNRKPLVLLHGSGGDEHDLVPVAEELAFGSPILAIRGGITFEDGFAFFRRFPDRSIDETDIAIRANVLADFIETVSKHYGLGGAPVAIGFSNGAIMAAALLLTRPDLMTGAILLRPLSPFSEDSFTRSGNLPVLIIDGEQDSRRSPGDGARLAERLVRAGAAVAHHVLPVGHAMTAMDKQIAGKWLAGLL
jgi:phospholipase/carboxylesterase